MVQWDPLVLLEYQALLEQRVQWDLLEQTVKMVQWDLLVLLEQ